MDPPSHSDPIAYLPALPERQPVGVEIDGYSLVLIRQGDHCQALAGRCLHQDQSLADGSVEDGQLICPAHGWRYHLSNGQVAHDPQRCLPSFRTWVEEDHVYVDRAAVAAQRKKEQPTSKNTAPRKIAELPSPPGWPLLGHLSAMVGEQTHAQLESWAQTYGSVYRMQLAGQPVVVIADGTLVRELLRHRPQGLRRYQKMGEVIEELGIAGLFTAEGSTWRRQRRFAARALAQRYVRGYAPLVAQHTQRLLDRWQQAAQQGQKLDPSRDLMRFTVDVTTQLAFGYEMNTLTAGEDTVQQHLERIFPMIQRRTMLPVAYWRHLKLPVDRRLDQALQAVRTLVQRYIDEARQRLAEDPTRQAQPENFLEALLSAADEDGSLFTDQEIFGNVFTMLLAGEDTTAHSIAWAIEALQQHPAWQTQLQAEVDAYLGEARTLPPEAQPSDLPRLQAVIHESMRLRPVAANLLLNALEDLRIGDLHVPRGSTIFALLRPMHLDPAHYPDPEAFRPERWLEGEHPTDLLTFGHGPRLCPGRNLALLEMTHVLAMLCRNFSWSAPPDAAPVREHHAFVVMPKGLQVQWQAR
jgi:cytochrome P450/nitrite reductase/ring-hydroxylating ferredoxin subunit